MSADGAAEQGAGASWDPQALIEQLAAGWRLGEIDAFIAHFRALMHPQVRSREPLGREEVGFAAFERRFRDTFALLPGLTASIESWGAREPNVFVEWKITAPAGRRPFEMYSCDRFTLSDGLIVERAIHFDPSAILAFALRRPSRWSALLKTAFSRP